MPSTAFFLHIELFHELFYFLHVADVTSGFVEVVADLQILIDVLVFTAVSCH